MNMGTLMLKAVNMTQTINQKRIPSSNNNKEVYDLVQPRPKVKKGQ